MKRDYRILIIAATAIVIGAVVALAAYLSANNIKQENQEAVEQAQQQQNGGQQAAPSTGGSNPPVVEQGTTGPLTYSQAVVKYADRRFTFDANCVTSPVIATYKNGTEIMLDNRAGFRRTVSVGGKAYNLEALGFKIIKLTASTFPTTLQIDCGSGKNNANIYLQK